MIGLVRKTDSFGTVEYFTIVGMTETDCFEQVSELTFHARECDTGNKFYLVATRQNGIWYDIQGKQLTDEYIKPFLTNIGD